MQASATPDISAVEETRSMTSELIAGGMACSHSDPQRSRPSRSTTTRLVDNPRVQGKLDCVFQDPSHAPIPQTRYYRRANAPLSYHGALLTLFSRGIAETRC